MITLVQKVHLRQCTVCFVKKTSHLVNKFCIKAKQPVSFFRIVCQECQKLSANILTRVQQAVEFSIMVSVLINSHDKPVELTCTLIRLHHIDSLHSVYTFKRRRVTVEFYKIVIIRNDIYQENESI